MGDRLYDDRCLRLWHGLDGRSGPAFPLRPLHMQEHELYFEGQSRPDIAHRHFHAPQTQAQAARSMREMWNEAVRFPVFRDS